VFYLVFIKPLAVPEGGAGSTGLVGIQLFDWMGKRAPCVLATKGCRGLLAETSRCHSVLT